MNVLRDLKLTFPVIKFPSKVPENLGVFGPDFVGAEFGSGDKLTKEKGLSLWDSTVFLEWEPH